jgi:hypothetical protein
MTNEERNKQLSEVLLNAKYNEDGLCLNVEFKNDNMDKWIDAGIPYWNFDDCEYRIKQEAKQRPRTDKEAKEFIRDNRDKIIIHFKHRDIGFVVWQYLLEVTDIAKDYVYCQIEDFNCEFPQMTIWQEFTITE